MKIGLVLTLCVLECLQWTNALTLHLATCDKKSPIPKSPHVIYVDTGKIRKFDCEDGYVINIDKSLDFRCVYKDSGYNIISRKYPTLSASEIRCKAKKECRSLSLKENVKVIEKKRYKLTKKSMTYGDMKRTGYYDGDEIEFECKHGYAEMKPGSGDDIYGIYDSPDYSNETSSTYSWSCQHGGWKGIDDKDLDQPTCAPIQCDASRFEVIENGYVLNYTSKYDYLDSMNLLCNSGYRPVEGRDSAACFDSLSFTQLSLPAFGCEETRCPTPGTPLHGYFDCDNRFYTSGTNCTFSCKHGYDLVGNRQWTCMENGEWNEECVKCTHADQYCESPCIPVESEVVSMDQIFSRGSELEFTCIDKNVINGSVTRTCMRNRKWSGGDIDCLGTKIFSGDEALDFADSLEQRFLRNETNTTTDDRDDIDAIYVKTINADSDTCCDIYFLLDMSESMTDDDFEESKKFIKALLPRIGISNSVDSTSVALYLFAQKVKRIFDQHYPWMDPGNGFANYTEAAEVIDTLDRKNIIGEIGQATDLSLALEIIERSADTKRARREREEIGLRDNVLILLSDGDYTGGGEPEEVADNLKEKLAFQIYSIAIGKDPGRMNLVTMRRIASEDDPKLPKDKHFIAIDKKNLNAIIDNMIHKGTDTSTECGFTNPLLTGIRTEGPMDKSAEADAWPWMVQLRTNTKGVCGGSLIARQWILTAAHCVKDNSVTKIRSQSIAYESKSGVDYEINEDNIYSHPNYSRDIDPKHVYDVALIKLNKRVVLTKRLHTVCLWNSTYAEKGIPLEGLYESGKFGVVTGWGPRPGGDDHSDTLKQLQIELQTEDICSSVLSKTHVDLRHMFCAGSPDPDSEFYLDTCRGDSGGPFIVENPIKPDFYIQTGIVSVGAGCGEEENYGFYTKLSEDILNWIHKTMADNKN